MFSPPRVLERRADTALRAMKSVCIALISILSLRIFLGAINSALSVVHLVVFWALADAIYALIKKLPFLRNKKVFFDFPAAVAMFTAIAYLTAGYFLAHDVSIARYSVETDKTIGNVRIVMFADSHIGTTFDGDGFAAHVKTMQAQEPDIVVIAGDFVDDDTSRADMTAACAALGTLKTTYGVFYAYGNHDKGYYEDSRRSFDADELAAELSKNGVTVLEDEHVRLDCGITVIGRREAEDERREGKPRADISDLTEYANASDFTLVINHQPTDYDNEAEAGVDLVLSGHTHGGQMFPIGMVSDIFGLNDRVYGRERRGSTDFIVTSGISDWAFKFKTGCRSEFVVIDVKGA